MIAKRKVEPLLTNVAKRIGVLKSMTKPKILSDSTTVPRLESAENEVQVNTHVSVESVHPSKEASKASFMASRSNKDLANDQQSSLKLYVSPTSRKLKTKPGLVTESLSVPLNKMSLKLYGSKKAVEEEKQRLERAGNWIIHPYSNFRLLWDCMTLLLLLVNITLIPVAITFWKVDQPNWLPFKV